ncbi:MAG: hypothetical protein V2J55_21655, partial [Candidatus Competibacteraceae bacterium]|nr:hypothetical protein [Candidatus Competibacteraceae bacterium]
MTEGKKKLPYAEQFGRQPIEEKTPSSAPELVKPAPQQTDEYVEDRSRAYKKVRSGEVRSFACVKRAGYSEEIPY